MFFTCIVDQHVHVAKSGGSGAHLVPDTYIELKGRDLDLGVFLEQVLLQVLKTTFATGSKELSIAEKRLGEFHDDSISIL